MIASSECGFGSCGHSFSASPHSVYRLPVPAAVSEVLSLLQQRLHQGAANAGVAVSIDPEAEPCARDADLGGGAALDHAVVSVPPFLHCFNDVRLSTSVLLLVSRRRQRGMKKGRVLQARPHPSSSLW